MPTTRREKPGHVRRGVFATLAGIPQSTTTGLFRARAKGRKKRGALADAVKLNRVDLGHPLVVGYFADRGLPPPLLTVLPPIELLTAEGGLEAPPTAALTIVEPSQWRAELRGLLTVEEVESVDDMTVPEFFERFGTLDGFKRLMEGMRHRADFLSKTLTTEAKRGDLISRDEVARPLIGIVETMNSRLIKDFPEAIAAAVIARALGPEENRRHEIAVMIRDSVSAIAQDAKKEVLKKLEAEGYEGCE